MMVLGGTRGGWDYTAKVGRVQLSGLAHLLHLAVHTRTVPRTAHVLFSTQQT